MKALVPPSPDALERALSPDIVDAAKDYASRARAENTRRAYESRWRGFVAWCASVDRNPLPASPETVVGYITVLAQRNLAYSTIALSLVAIGEAHKLAGEPDPKDDRVVQEVWKGIQRTIGTAPIRPATPLQAPLLKELVDALPSNLIGLRDGALLLVGFAAALRRSELVGLDAEDVTMTPEGCVLRIGGRDAEGRTRRTKTDQEGQGTSVGIPFGTSKLMCPVASLEVWMTTAKIESGPLFRSVNRWERIGDRLSPIDVARAVKNAIDRVGGKSDNYSGHSLRSGMATSAAKAGKSSFAIRDQGRWKSSQTLDRYVRESALFTNNAAKGLI